MPRRFLLALSCLGATLGSQTPTDWRRLPLPQARHGHAFAVDPASGEAVLQGGASAAAIVGTTYNSSATWLWNGTRWRIPTLTRPALDIPAGGAGQQFLVDTVRRRLLLVGGYDAQGQTEQEAIWQYRSGVWTRLSGGGAPGPRPSQTRYAYDEARDRIVAIEWPGNANLTTWEWAHGVWQPLAPAAAPTSRWHPALVYDAARQRVVLFGGMTTAGGLNDTWEWDGNRWQQAQGAVAPPPRAWAAMVHDPGNARTLLVGGADAQYQCLTDLWAYGAGGWALIAGSGVPGRGMQGCAWDPARQRLLLMGGRCDFATTGELWEWDGVGWRSLAPTATMPLMALVTDLGQGKLLGLDGGSGVFERWRDGWVQVAGPGPGPPPRSCASTCWDVNQGRTVLFGGLGLSSLGDTWHWDGAVWTQMQPAVSPSPRHSAGFACDPNSGSALLFGGQTATGQSNETWRWDGTTWTQLFPATSPVVGADARMAWDPLRRVIVLVDRSSTWEWTGATWANRGTAWTPARSTWWHLCFDWARGVVSMVVFVPSDRGLPPSLPTTEIWDWNGLAWTQASRTVAWFGAVGSPLPDAFGYDPASGRCVLTDTYSGDGGTFEWGRMQAPASVRWLGHGCTPGTVMWTYPLYLGEPVPVRFQVTEPAATPCFLMLGWSGTNWNGTPLPLDLGGYGAPTCRLLVSPDVIVYLGLSDRHEAPVAYLQPPWQPQLVGLDLHVQGAYSAPSRNAAGLRLTDGYALRIGLR